MEILPTELFISVISFLPLSSKLQCVGVSKNWNNLITRTVLFEKLELKGSLHKFRQAIKYFDERSALGERVRHLTLYQKYMDTADILMLPKIFPNVKTIDWSECYNGVYCDLSKIVVPSTWHHLKGLKYKPQHHPNMPCLFKYFNFPKLKHLEVNFGFNHDVSVVQSMVHGLLKELCKTPALESLVMIRASISLHDMEYIYSVLPALKRVKLVQAYLSPEYREIPVKIEASQLMSLHMDYFGECEKFGEEPLSSDVAETTHIQTMSKWITYISRRFRNIENLCIVHCREQSDSHVKVYKKLERAFEKTICSLPHIKSYKIIY